MSVCIVTDSTCDLPLSYVQEHNITVFSFPVRLGKQEFLVGLDPNEPGSISTEEFYRRIGAGELASTAQVPVHTYFNTFQTILERGDDILYLCFSSGLTDTLNGARFAWQSLEEKFPDRKICFVDTLGASIGEAMVVMETVKKLETEGGTLEELAEFAEQTVRRVKHWFTVNDLHYLARGGRLSGSAAFVGTLLNVKPILDISAEGKLVPREKVQGRKKALKVMADKFFAHCDPAVQEMHIASAGCDEDAEFVKSYVEEKGGRVGMIAHVTPIIVAHTGLGLLAIFYLSDDPRNP